MPRKKSIKKAAKSFNERADSILVFVSAVPTTMTDDQKSWVYDYAIIRLYREFESLVLEALVGAINNDTKTISSRVGIEFPKHLTDELCQFLIVGDGYFDFKGRDGLIGTVKRFVPDTHYFVDIVKQEKYKEALERLSALRNLAAHESFISKTRARKAIDGKRIASAGSWLKKKDRFRVILEQIKELAREIENKAPY